MDTSDRKSMSEKAADLVEQYTVMLSAATNEIFETMVMLPLESNHLMKVRPAFFSESVSAVVGLSGGLRGMIAIHCPDPVALAIFGAMLGEDPELVNDEVRDTIGEIGNMVAGGLKTRLQKEGCGVELSVPSIISGKSYEVNLLSRAEWLLQPFTTPSGTFLVELKYTQPQ